MALTTNINVTVTGQQTGTHDQGTPKLEFSKALALALASGTGASQADRFFSDTRTLSASATEDLDLAGVLTDVFGATITFAKIKAILVFAAAGNTNDVQVTRPASNGVPIFLAAGDGLPVKPGGCFALVWPGTGVTVTTGTGDLLTLTNSAGGTGVDYTIVIIGTSA